MSLVDQQRVLAQLYTNTNLRECFLADPQGVGKELGLEEQDISAIAAISSRQLTLFARSLQNKRLGEIYKLLPLTYQVLGKKFKTLFPAYADTYVPQGRKKHRDDAIHFAAYIERITREKGLEPVWAADLLRYERAWLDASETTRHFTLAHFNYSIEKLVLSLSRNEGPPVLEKRHTTLLWLRLSSGGRLWRIRL